MAEKLAPQSPSTEKAMLPSRASLSARWFSASM